MLCGVVLCCCCYLIPGQACSAKKSRFCTVQTMPQPEGTHALHAACSPQTNAALVVFLVVVFFRLVDTLVVVLAAGLLIPASSSTCCSASCESTTNNRWICMYGLLDYQCYRCVRSSMLGAQL